MLTKRESTLNECVTICAPFRNSESYLGQLIHLFNDLDYPADKLHFICVEGDSTDDTWNILQRWCNLDRRVTLLKCDTGKPKYDSVVSAERFKILAQVFNTALDAVDLEWSDYVMFTPSDVLFERDVLLRLLSHQKDLIAPFFWMRMGMFYDIWGFCRNGVQFVNFPKKNVVLFGDEPIEMDTVGGMVLMRSEVLKAGCRYTEAEVDRGLCKEAKAKGFTVWADPTTHIVHRHRED